MSNYPKHSVEDRIRRAIWALLKNAPLAAFLSFSVSATAVPVITQASGTFNHSASVTITGLGFGTKAQAAPVVWDDASGTNILSKWDGAWPNKNPTYNTTYRVPQRSIGLPHANITKYIAGSHYGTTGFDAGYNVIFWKNRNIAAYPAYTYASWYQRMDDAWTFGIGSPPDDNLKNFAFSVCCSPYELPNNWYISYWDGPHNKSSTSIWAMNDDSSFTSLQHPDINGHSAVFWNGSYVNPMAGAWSKIELEIKYSNATDGYIKMWENGSLKIDHRGYNDRYAGRNRTEGIGGYSRADTPTNWRYFADVYLDYTPARVVLANNPVLSLATRIETQIPSSWNNTSITISVNLGRFTAGQTAYLFVVDSAGVRNVAGLPITVGGPATQVFPSPTNLQVQ